ncbi:stromelysin-3-like isoform X1 [Anopheles albimanus]|uniref:stromelysin-3-like isoform X1 n=1 Tax=Anopheles albimanus TaxID=7167 RepID=UPI00163EA900|nr:stromelysin-3-like isoform X1 [Anopheles albimanus]XP_035785462.1 stromelysin-3-like isoform X1 [Anopheles albimanus]XP_035785463.1 stromelysin-3-like isoform X1 [Anopheles albimanus]XP_035785464.1 stromelysin-3-like isoform X1 [Anopheles albimanus]XP_035785465.1 stromelysin-3-like isoform X1 [Anopheles albimanus]XP_035785467.1 stromelysin-3-like isoform X1 [Anopheles albimanus]
MMLRSRRDCRSSSSSSWCCGLLGATLLMATILAYSGTAATPIRATPQAELYLSQFGYLSPKYRNPTSGNLLDQDTWEKAIMEFQSFAGLNVTGELDSETMQLMSLPRCGVKDRVGFGSDTRSKRYALQGSRWKVKDLTYRISKYPRRLERTAVDNEIAKAFGVWSRYTDLRFTPKRTGAVHIDIRFEENEHGDGDPFDGPGGTLAHAYFPVYGGDAHFDDAEQWTIDKPRGTNLFQVAAHEFGHSLGLSHSDVRSALMAPFYRGYDPVFQLDSDDVTAIQTLYGPRTRNGGGGGAAGGDGGTPTRTPKPKDTPKDFDSELCSTPKIDAVFNTADGSTYAFKGNNYYKLTENAVAEGYPKKISEGWPGLPGNIDAAFTYKNGKTYFFQGTKYWRYQGRQVDGDYPKEISDGFTGIPDHLDAAMVWGGNGKIYFYKGSKFWRFDPLKRPPVKSTYPKPISNWEGVPNNIDAALQYTNGYTYFFKDDKYYRFNDRTFTVDQSDPPFPRPTAHWWYGCKNTPSTFNTLGNVRLEKSDDHPDGYADLNPDAAGTDERPAPDEYSGDRDSGATTSIPTFSIVLSITLFLATVAMWRN